MAKTMNAFVLGPSPVSLRHSLTSNVYLTHQACDFATGSSLSLFRAARPRLSGSTIRAALGDTVEKLESDVVEQRGERIYDPSGMTVEEFFQKSLGKWKSQRSSHNLVWSQFETITSEIFIDEKSTEDEAVKELCQANSVPVENVLMSIEMKWEGESDWDDDQTLAGSSLMAVVKDTPKSGRLLRSAGYAETIPAVGTWVMMDDGAFVLKTFYDAAAAEERIWFATPDLRLRVSNIRTSSGRGIVTSSFSSEIRVLKREAPKN